MSRRRFPVKTVTFCALMAALCAVCSQISIMLPFTPVPLNLGTFAVFMSGALAGGFRGGISLAVYVCLGALGLPVFAGFSGGFGILFGPTGGYIAGYIIAALICGLLIERRPGAFPVYPLAMTLALSVCYLFGTLWYSLSAGVGFGAALGFCVFPFIPGDIIKIMLASVLSFRLRRRLPALHS